MNNKKRCIILIDGEHYPPVVRDAVKHLEQEYNLAVCAGVFLGGTEKIDKKQDLSELLGITLFLEGDFIDALRKALDALSPDIVFDLSDEPVVSCRDRFRIASFLMGRGVCYKGSDFEFSPPEQVSIAQKPSIMVAGTGKRVGKTAVGAYVARLLSGQEQELSRVYDPCIVTMGRGGPSEPEVIEGETLEMDQSYFLDQLSMGKHAASDHYEDALMSRVRTIGCRRCGGGFSGQAFYSIVKQGAELANTFLNDLIIFEGSGATNPPVRTDGCIMVIGAHQDEEYVSSYMGPYRIKLADIVVLTMCEPPMADKEKVRSMLNAIKRISPDIQVLRTVFRPKPLRDIRGKNAIFCTTAPISVNKTLVDHLENVHGANVVGVTNNLSNRALLEKELLKMFEEQKVDVLLTEVKAASIDIATKLGVEHSLEIVYVDNLPVVLDDHNEQLSEAVLDLADRAEKRFNK